MSERGPLYGLVLAGGRSRRMGHDKASLDREGQSQLNYVFSLLREVTDQTFVSTREDQAEDQERRPYPKIVDRYDDMGPVAGILSALETHSQVDWLVVACDLPNLDKHTLEYLIEKRSSDKPFTAYRSSYDGLPEPLCAIYRAGSDATIRAFIDDNIICPRKILIRAESELLDQPNPNSLDNVNTPDDLAGSILQSAR